MQKSLRVRGGTVKFHKPRGLYFSKTLFEGLFLEGLMFGGVYLWREICVSKSSGLAL